MHPQNAQPDAYNNSGQANKRPNNSSARYTGPKQQRINHIASDNAPFDNEDNEYSTVAEEEAENTDDDLTEYDQVNF